MTDYAYSGKDRRRFKPINRNLVARVMPFDLVIDEETSDGQEARVSRSKLGELSREPSSITINSTSGQVWAITESIAPRK